METQKVFEELRSQYPDVEFKMGHKATKGWMLSATGPYGSLSLLTPDIPLRLATLEAACQLVGRNNLERKAAHGGVHHG